MYGFFAHNTVNIGPRVKIGSINVDQHQISHLMVFKPSSYLQGGWSYSHSSPVNLGVYGTKNGIEAIFSIVVGSDVLCNILEVPIDKG
jgi:hypothetical protein